MEIIEQYKPDVVSLESLFFNRNTKTALIVGEARGIVLLAAGKHSVPVVEFTPLQVKECLAGFGRAKKDAVAEVVKMELDIEDDKMPVDASDALGLAICYYRMDDIE
jgi:crossover junction endodeoxyribonuclease RuvC